MVERRKEQRWPAYLSGRIVFGDRACTAECLIRNTGRSGARLVMDGAGLLPDEFSLQIPHWKTEMRVRTRWRRYEHIGVEKVPDHEAQPVDLAMMRYIKRLETHNATLARRVAELTEPPV